MAVRIFTRVEKHLKAYMVVRTLTIQRSTTTMRHKEVTIDYIMHVCEEIG